MMPQRPPASRLDLRIDDGDRGSVDLQASNDFLGDNSGQTHAGIAVKNDFIGKQPKAFKKINDLTRHQSAANRRYGLSLLAFCRRAGGPVEERLAMLLWTLLDARRVAYRF